MKNYTNLKSLKEAIKSTELMKEESFYFKGIDCRWADWDTETDYLTGETYIVCNYDRLRCDPSTDKQYKDFELLRRHLEPKIIVDLS